MSIKLYYTVSTQILEDDGYVIGGTGWKNVIVYKIEDNIPKIVVELEIAHTYNTEEEIATWMEESEEWRDQDFELELL